MFIITVKLYLNTSHVKVKPNPALADTSLGLTFKYISC